ncbi:MAG: pyrroloquinoline quinone-dependent dehydrogenase [Myxococcota bacterium]
MRRSRRAGCWAAAIWIAAMGCGSPSVDYEGPTADWPEYAGDKGGSRYSALTQVDRENVAHLELAWSHHSGDAFPGSAEQAPTALQVTPLVTNDTLYYCTPYMRVFALDPETGEERWSFDPELRGKGVGGPYPLTCRGVAYWEDPDPERVGEACRKRILYGTRDSELIALDADDGRLCEGFGNGGRVPLREGIGGEVPDWEYYPTSPPLVIRDVAVLGALVADQLKTDAPSGVVRAFDVRTGELRWAWDPVPPGWTPDPPEGEWYQRGTPNVWSLLSGDEERGLVFVPTGNPSPDSFGGARRGIDHFGSSTVALDAESGDVVWHYQTVHHDVWDYDVPAQPQLFRHPAVGRGRPAVVQPTKMGHLFLLDRETGEPLYPVEERPVPQAGVPEETLAATQPFPTHPPPLHDTELHADNLFGFTPIDRASCVEQFEALDWEGPFTPPTTHGSIQYPHTSGGMNWGGVAIDPERGLLITNQTHVAMVVRLVPRADFEDLPASALVYPNEAYPMRGTPYGVIRHPFFSSFGAPCNPPPWGSLTAVDLATGDVRWRVPLGTTRDQAPFPVWALPFWGELGAPNFGGGLLTAGGVYFIGATTDKYFRAFDADSGEELWRTRIPFTANATPATYRLRASSRQFVVVAAGGNPLTGTGDALLAFALPE